MSEFSERVWRVLQQVPSGKVITYQLLAQAAGKPKAFRAVGTILNHNTQLIVLPCHRVVKSNGSVGEYVSGIDKKISLLISEGVVITNEKINLAHYLVKNIPYETN